jgi:hypothetical protein
MKGKFLAGLVAAVLMFASAWLPGIGYAATYDLKTDWSDSSNPNGVWTYREGENALPLQTDWYGTNDGSFMQPAWALAQYPATDHAPVWLKQQTVLYDLQIGDVVVHPASHSSTSNWQDRWANVIWTSPIDGTITISGNVWWGADSSLADRYTYWELFLNDDSLASGIVGWDDIYDRSNPMLIDGGGVLAVDPGDIVMLKLTQIDGSHWGWMTGVNLTIDATPVPAPAALLLLGTGIAGLFGIRLRRGKK